MGGARRAARPRRRGQGPRLPPGRGRARAPPFPARSTRRGGAVEPPARGHDLRRRRAPERRVFMVMEIMRGGTIGDRLKSGREISHEELLRWLREAAGALDTAHEAGVVHRDIKPGNLLLDDHDRLAVADFGIARVAWEDQLTATGQVLGTAAYLSPEQALGEPATAASDRYALAVVAYELLTGKRPFEAEHFAAQARAHVEDPVPPASSRADGLSRAVDAVLERGLAKEAEDRWESSAQFVDELERTLGPRARRRRAPTRRLFGRRPAAAPAAARPRAAARPPRAARAAADARAARHRRRRATAAAAATANGRHAAAAPRRRAPRRRSAAAPLLVGLAGLALIAVIAAVALATRGDDPEPRAARAEHAGGDGDAEKTPTESRPRPRPRHRPTRPRRTRPRPPTAAPTETRHARRDRSAAQRQARPQGGQGGADRRLQRPPAPATTRPRWPRPARPSSCAATPTSSARAATRSSRRARRCSRSASPTRRSRSSSAAWTSTATTSAARSPRRSRRPRRPPEKARARRPWSEEAQGPQVLTVTASLQNRTGTPATPQASPNGIGRGLLPATALGLRLVVHRRRRRLRRRHQRPLQ